MSLIYAFASPSTTMNDHITLFNKLIVDLLDLDESINNEDKSLLLLTSLPSEYDHLTITLLHEKDEVSFDKVCFVLYNNKLEKWIKRSMGILK